MGSRLDHIIKENLARLRKLTGMSQIDFAKAVGIEPNTYWNLEKGKTTIVNENLDLLADYYKVSVEKLILGYEPLDMDSDPRLEEFKKEYGQRKELEADHLLKENIRLKAELEQQKDIIEILKTTIEDKTQIINFQKRLKSQKSD
ncbi:MAG: helix-turn-helix transcriptional regulator [Bacteroidales bacterium]|jgi:transcriptional regulator with XRE-family HTH domain|nr:helix-turn-helix transcriptional regulator [Bacteroidales bacterium]MBQ2091124.1 helix-turn-helix transcriptional regulator [Bacteroidales bacterium]MBQ7467293.1 helix-turn-helix transcriptional regulator [Bacteroidales bacterium]MBQ8460960.1 helix-turn-helix transcriptional regulator [Bacteroidales bacterium]MDT3361380.1 helix-turn-helix transcriptional regulator [Bacteroidota bacterium]